MPGPRQLELFPEAAPPAPPPAPRCFWSYHCPRPECPFAEVRCTPPPKRCPMCGKELSPPKEE